MVFHKTLIISKPDITPPHDFNFQFNHYVLAPEMREGDCLVEIIRLATGRVVKVNVASKGTTQHPRLKLTISSPNSLSNVELDEVIEKVAWRLCFREDLKPFYELVKDDPILQASIKMHFGAKDKRSLTVFDALIDAICGQNIRFERLYVMMSRLTQMFGKPMQLGKVTYYAFPTPDQLAKAPLKTLQTCGLGYRAKFIKSITSIITKNKLNLGGLKNLSLEEAQLQLMQLPGVGPYTADLALVLGVGRLDVLHLDLFAREVLWTFYFHGREAPNQELREFATQRWGCYQAYAGLYLMTNTEVWAKRIGKDFRLRSRAQHYSRG